MHFVDISSLWEYIEFMGIFRVIIFMSCIVNVCFNQSFIKRRFSFTTFCACANFVNINISANALW